MPAPAPERVLPTLNPDGSRNRLRPKPFAGRFASARRIVAWGLLGTFFLLPFVRIGGAPALLVDLPGRRLHFFGATLLATDGIVLTFFLLAVFVGIFFLSALLGRVWCGWGCPQTVYMEFVFRPIERLFEGTRSRQLELDRNGADGWRIAKYGVFAVLSVVVGNVFLAYFVGVEALGRWITSSPFAHPMGFLTMAITAALVFIDFAYFREQMCTVACPYARLQAVLLDRHSLVVGYDARRGEPRSRKAKADAGDCIDCNNCVVTCPTGIDIRQGLQHDCIACAQCADACDWVMDKLGRPRGLVRYGSQESLAGGRTRFVRTRVILYAGLVLVALVALTAFALGRGTADVTVLRGLGTPYVVEGELVRNLLRIKIENRSGAEREYHFEILGAPGSQLVAPENPLRVADRTHQTTTVFVVAPRALFANGPLPIQVRVWDGDRLDREVPYQLVGPREAGSQGR